MAIETNSTKAAVLKLLARGEIALFEAAKLSGESRQRIHYWVKVANIDLEAAREAHLARIWRAHCRR